MQKQAKKSKEKEPKISRWDKQKTTKKLVNLSHTISIIT